jgi:pyruvate dehydrogenase E2 component (dihydrolipoamide acetyltransferase)
VAREHGLDLAHVEGSGPRGRVQEADARAAVEQLRPQATPHPGIALPSAPEVVPLQGMRQIIATRMQQSYQTAPHIMLSVEADMTAAQALRGELNTRAEATGAPGVSVTALLVKVCAWALKRHRQVNASLRDRAIQFHDSAHIGVAVALDDGLIVPVIRHAERLGMAEIAAHLQDLTDRARRGRLTPADVGGGTFTISNLGMYGIDHFTAIINPPESALLAVGRIAKRAIVVERETQDEVVIRPTMYMTLAADHRVLDGAIAARFLRDVVDALEHPGLLLW